MKDRVPTYPGRVRMTPVQGQENVYDMERADEPTQVGTPLNKNTLLDDGLVDFFNDYIDTDENITLNQGIKIIEQQLYAECQTVTTSQNIVIPSVLDGGNLSVIAVGGGGGGTQNVGGGSGWVKFKRSIPIQTGDVINVVIGAGGQGRLYGDAQVATAGGTTTVKKNGTTILSAQGGGISPDNCRGADGAAGSGAKGVASNTGSSNRNGGIGYQFGGGGAAFFNNYSATISYGGNGGKYGGGGGGNGIYSTTDQYPNNGGIGGQYGGNGGSGGISGTYASHPYYTGLPGTAGIDMKGFYMPIGYAEKKIGTDGYSSTFTSVNIATIASHLTIDDYYLHDSQSVRGAGGAGDTYQKSSSTSSGSDHSASGGGGGGGGYGSKGGAGSGSEALNIYSWSGNGGGGGGFGAGADGAAGAKPTYNSSGSDYYGAGGSGGGFFGAAGTSNALYGSGGAGGFFASGGTGGGSASTSQGGTGAGGGCTGAMASDSTETTWGKGGDGIVLLFFTKRRLLGIPEDL